MSSEETFELTEAAPAAVEEQEPAEADTGFVVYLCRCDEQVVELDHVIYSLDEGHRRHMKRPANRLRATGKFIRLHKERDAEDIQLLNEGIDSGRFKPFSITRMKTDITVDTSKMCRHCNEVFGDQDALVAHVVEVHLRCPHCSVVLKSKSERDLHVTQQHPGENTERTASVDTEQVPGLDAAGSRSV